MNVVVFGATGMLGVSIVRALTQREDRVVAVSRRNREWNDERVTSLQWTAKPGTDEPWRREVERADAVLNLSGEPILGKRWTADFKQRLRQSRLDSTLAVVEAIREASHKPSAFLNASATGYYGDAGETAVDESSLAGDDFVSTLVRDWESAAREAEPLTRVALLRIGIVLGTRGGALDKMVPLFKLGLGGRLGPGRQWVSWIHEDDLAALVLRCLDDASIAGPVNLVAPTPVRNAELTRALGRVLHRPTWFPAPAFALRAVLGESSQMVLSGANVKLAHPALREFQFKFPELEPALRDLIAKR